MYLVTDTAGIKKQKIMNTQTKPNDTITGLTKREYFAAMAMQAVISKEQGFDPMTMSFAARSYADALIHELNAPSK